MSCFNSTSKAVLKIQKTHYHMITSVKILHNFSSPDTQTLAIRKQGTVAERCVCGSRPRGRASPQHRPTQRATGPLSSHTLSPHHRRPTDSSPFFLLHHSQPRKQGQDIPIKQNAESEETEKHRRQTQIWLGCWNYQPTNLK